MEVCFVFYNHKRRPSATVLLSQFYRRLFQPEPELPLLPYEERFALRIADSPTPPILQIKAVYDFLTNTKGEVRPVPDVQDAVRALHTFIFRKTCTKNRRKDAKHETQYTHNENLREPVYLGEKEIFVTFSLRMHNRPAWTHDRFRFPIVLELSL